MMALKVGIMQRDKFQQRIIDIAAGRYKVTSDEPKIWFSSMKSLSEVLSDNNLALLKLISEKKPETLTMLAELSGRKISNLSRTLKTMERYGIVQLKKQNRSVKPIAMATSFNIQYAA